MRKLSHIDPRGGPAMVDISRKNATQRRATAQSIVRLPHAAARTLSANGLRTAKGQVFDTAVIAGVMAAKRTHELIPFCHPLGIENCRVEIKMRNATDVEIRCTVRVRHKTGVEMEALTGASVAALTIYDMCKALSHDIVIVETCLIEKRGGKTGRVFRAASKRIEA